MRSIHLLHVVCAALLSVTAAPFPGAAEESTNHELTITGSAAYRQRIAMPPDAVLTVRVEDVSRADAASALIAESREIFGKKQVPLAFTLKIPSAVIQSRSSYAVRATISVNDRLRFTTTRSYPVLTRGAPTQVDLLLDPVSTPLTDTYWKLIELNGAGITPAPQQDSTIHIILAREGSQLMAFGGCNRLAGGYTRTENTLQFSQIAATMMACRAPFMEQEDQFLKMLAATTGYRIEGDDLSLLGGDRTLARFTAVNR